MARSRTSIRSITVTAVVLAAVMVLGSVAMAAVTWNPADSARTANRPRTCNSPALSCTDSAFTQAGASPSFAVSNSGTTHYQHAAWFSDHDGDSSGAYADYKPTCSGNCAAVFYGRSADGGATWNGGPTSTDATRISPTTITGQRPAIATSGSYVYIAYITTQGYWDSMCANSDRLLYVAVNSNYGAGTWTTTQLTASGRVDFPSIAASGNNVYVAVTHSNNGAVMVYRSTNLGSAFTGVRAGWTANTYDNLKSPSKASTCPGAPTPSGLEGFDGAPQVAADGSTVATTWVDTNGRVKAKISVDAGASWPGNGDGTSCTTGTNYCTVMLASAGAIGPVGSNPATARGTASVTAGGGRVAFAWKNTSGANGVPKGIYERNFSVSGGWGPPRLISCLQTTGSCAGAPAGLIYNDAVATAVALYGTTGIGVTWAACPYTPTAPAIPCNNTANGQSADPGSEILFKESWDNGGNWWDGQSGSYARIAANSATNSEANEFPTLVYDKPGAASTGCAQAAKGPEVGCVRNIYYMGRRLNFFAYSAYLSYGTQS